MPSVARKSSAGLVFSLDAEILATPVKAETEAATGPTNADGAELVKEVRDRGIPQSLLDRYVAQTLAAICDTATNLASDGYGKDYLVGLYGGKWMYPLFQRDADWLIDAVLPKFD